MAQGSSLYVSIPQKPVVNTKTQCSAQLAPILGGSWVVISGLISRVTRGITHITGLITPLITTHEPPSTLKLLNSENVHSAFTTGKRSWAFEAPPTPKPPKISTICNPNWFRFCFG